MPLTRAIIGEHDCSPPRGARARETPAAGRKIGRADAREIVIAPRAASKCSDTGNHADATDEASPRRRFGIGVGVGCHAESADARRLSSSRSLRRWSGVD